MENLLFIKSEIIIFLLSLLYIIYYLWTKLYNLYFKFRNIVKPQTIKNRKSALNKVSLNNKNNWKNTVNKIILSDNQKQELSDLLAKVKTNSSKWYFDTAKNLIVEWLSIDKYNKELNLQLGLIYEKEKNYSNAEYIYKELLDNYNWDYIIMKNLWYILAIQDKLTESLIIYELLHKKKKFDNEVIEIISDLSFTLKNYKKALKFINLYLSSKPRNIDKLWMKAISLDELWNYNESIDIYKRILELQPYNTKAKENLEFVKEKIKKEKINNEKDSK